MNPIDLPLRDIHLPPDPSWFPPAWGWFALLLLALALVMACIHWRRRRAPARGIARDLRDALFVLRLDYIQTPDKHRLLNGLSVWYRRALISAFPPARCASLLGEAWLRELDRFDPEQRRFTSGVGRVLAHGPYLRASEFDADALLALSEEWLRCFIRSERKGKLGIGAGSKELG